MAGCFPKSISRFRRSSVPGLRPAACIALMLLFLTLTSCAPKSVVSIPKPSSCWAAFLDHQKSLALLTHFSIRTSINYTSGKHTHRVIMRLFGSLEYPVRMNLEAGMGQTLSTWYEGTDLWQAYFPREQRLYTAKNARKGIEALGFPSPFELKELALILQGSIASLLPEQPAREEVFAGGSKIFFARPCRVAWMLMDASGRVLELRGASDWHVVFDGSEASPYSRTIVMTMDETTRAVIRIKSVKPAQFSSELFLEYPQDTEVIDLDALRTAPGSKGGQQSRKEGQ